MYSMVLMAAMTSGMEAPDLGKRRNGCYGGSYAGCYGGGGGGGCYGGYARGGGCYGGGMVMGGYGGFGARGGCFGGYPMGGMYRMGGPGMYYPRGSEGLKPPKEDKGKKPDKPDGDKTPEDVSTAPATLIVHLPADASLTIDGAATHSASGTRLFFSPPLQPGKAYTYTLEAKLRHRGEALTVRQDVVVRAGQRSEVRLEPPARATASR